MTGILPPTFSTAPNRQRNPSPRLGRTGQGLVRPFFMGNNPHLSTPERWDMDDRRLRLDFFRKTPKMFLKSHHYRR